MLLYHAKIKYEDRKVSFDSIESKLVTDLPNFQLENKGKNLTTPNKTPRSSIMIELGN
jgi:hypothetical protein